MRNLTAGNKVNFTIFTIIILVILVILIYAVVMVLRTEKELYTISSNSSIYDKNYNYIELENDAEISKKWTGNYYLTENETENSYDLGSYSVSFENNRKMLSLYGTFYEVLEGGDISKISGYNTINTNYESKFYKIDDRKYLIVSSSIQNDTGTLSTQNYLIIIVDKLGNALLLNNVIDAKTINEMIINTNDFKFDVANEVLMYENESINLKKIIGSTNEYVPQEEETNDTQDENVIENTEIAETESQDAETVTHSTSTSTSTSTTSESTSTTIIQEAGSNTTQSNTQQDTSWINSLNSWIQDVAAGFQSIYNGNSGKKEETTLTKSVTLNSLSADTTYIDINYTVVDPENKYNVVYANVSDGVKSYNISLDKNATTYRLENLNPNTNYSVDIGYKIIYADANADEVIEDTMTVRTKDPIEDLTITRVSKNKIYYTLKLDSNFIYDLGAKLVIYVNDEEHSIIELTDNNLQKASSSGYTSSFKIPEEYKIKNTTLEIRLENTTYNGTTINTNIAAKIINY